MLVKEFLQCLAGFCRNLLQSNALMTDDDTLLTVALHVDDGIDVNLTVVFLETLYHHLYAVRNLLVVEEKYFLADNLGHKETGGLSVSWSLSKKAGLSGSNS